jgi:type 1 glutamine amidotransferase
MKPDDREDTVPNVLILSGPNHGFDRSAPLIDAFLQRAGITTTLTDDKGVLASSELARFDVVVLGTGFTRPERQPDGTRRFVSELTVEQAEGLFAYVRGGKGFLGIHGTGWWIGGEAVRLVGGHANWHPPGLEFTVHIEDPAHPITQGIADFTVQDEIYMSAWDPAIHVLATATWAERKHPMAWIHRYGAGRVFYTTLGHGPSTFEHPAMQRFLTNAVLWLAG